LEKVIITDKDFRNFNSINKVNSNSIKSTYCFDIFIDFVETITFMDFD